MGMDPISPQDNFSILNKCLGWGDPGNPKENSRSLWIIGIEEATLWEKKDIKSLVSDYINSNFLPVTKADKAKWKNEGSKVRYYTSLIAKELSRKARGSKIIDYEFEMLWEEGSSICQANLYPLGKPSLVASHSKDDLRDLWGLSNLSEYYEKVKNERFPHLKALHHNHKPQATICFGKTTWGICEEIFDLQNGCFEGPRKHNVMFFDRQRFILTGFFDNRQMNSDKAELIAEKLKSWNVTLP